MKRTLPTLLDDSISTLIFLVHRIPSGYYYQAFELVGACRRISFTIHEQAPEQLISKMFLDVVEHVRKALQERKKTESLFDEATKKLIVFCNSFIQVSEEGIAARVRGAKEHDADVAKKIRELKQKCKKETPSTTLVTLSVQVNSERKKGNPEPKYEPIYNRVLTCGLPDEVSLSFVLSMLVDKERLILMQNPNLYKKDNVARTRELEEIQPLPLEGTVGTHSTQGPDRKTRLLVLVDNLGCLSIRYTHGRPPDLHYGITFDPTGKQEVILKDPDGRLCYAETVLPREWSYEDISSGLEPPSKRKEPLRILGERLSLEAGRHWLVIQVVSPLHDLERCVKPTSQEKKSWISRFRNLIW